MSPDDYDDSDTDNYDDSDADNYDNSDDDEVILMTQTMMIR